VEQQHTGLDAELLLEPLHDRRPGQAEVGPHRRPELPPTAADMSILLLGTCTHWVVALTV